MKPDLRPLTSASFDRRTADDGDPRRLRSGAPNLSMGGACTLAIKKRDHASARIRPVREQVGKLLNARPQSLSPLCGRGQGEGPSPARAPPSPASGEKGMRRYPAPRRAPAPYEHCEIASTLHSSPRRTGLVEGAAFQTMP